MPLLELKGISKAFHNLQVLSNISLEVDRGQAIGIVGESGAGKTTLAAIAAGLVKPSSGKVIIEGAAVDGRAQHGRKQRARTVQLIWQDVQGSLNPRMSVGRAIAEPLKIHRLAERGSVKKHVSNLLAEVGLKADTANRLPRSLSGGEAQRVVIARALATNPRLLICDEPASALDARAKLRVVELLDRLRRERNLACLIITHDLSLARMLADEVVVMHRGVIVETGPTAEVLRQPDHPYTKLLVNSEPLLQGV